MLNDDSTSSESTSKATIRSNSRASPEMVPSYGKIIKNLIDHRVKTGSNFWNKENGEKDKDKVRFILSPCTDTYSYANVIVRFE